MNDKNRSTSSVFSNAIRRAFKSGNCAAAASAASRD
jgi:hypothetical protein